MLFYGSIQNMIALSFKQNLYLKIIFKIPLNTSWGLSNPILPFFYK